MAKKSKVSAPSDLAARKAEGGAWTRRNFAPVVYLFIDDKPADDLLRQLVTFTHKDSLDKASETKWSFRNDNKTLMDDPRTFPNKLWKFRFGYFDDMSEMLVGIIRLVEPTYKDKRMVDITLYDATSQLVGKSAGRNWGIVPSVVIAEKIANEHGLKFTGDISGDTPKKAFIQPKNVNDLQYLRDLAADIDFEVYVEGTTLHYQEKKYGAAPKRVLTYFDDPTEFSYVKEFRPKLKSLGPIASGVSSTNAATGAQNKSATDKNKDPALGGLVTDFVVVKDAESGATTLVPKAKSTDVTKPAPANSNTKALAAVAHQQMLDKANEASSSHPLTPSLHKGGVYEWAGIEKQLSGKWYLVEATHTISGTTSQTTCEWKRNAKNAGSKTASTNKNNKTAEGSAPKNPYVIKDAESGATTFVPGGGSYTPIAGFSAK